MRTRLPVLGFLACCWGACSTLAYAEPIEWPADSGGNGHYYEIVLTNIGDFGAAQTAANAMTYSGMGGHLATLTSYAEDQWVRENLIFPHTTAPGTLYLGGWNDSFWSGYSWRWVTDESWEYTGWAPGEPGGSEEVLSFNTGNGPSGDGWNDLGYTYPNALGYVVEYDGLPVTFRSLRDPLPPNLLQWPMSEGGNDHYYEIVVTPIGSFDAAQTMANAMSHGGLSGHLVTLTSSAEDLWVREHLIFPYTESPGPFYIGGWDDRPWAGTGWRWVTDEPWSYAGWAPGEPSGDGPVLSFNAGNGPSGDGWNDLGYAYPNALGYVVEYDGLPVTFLSLDGPVAQAAVSWGGVKALYR